LALNWLAGFPLNLAELRDLASGLGSDVPFFLLGGTVLATGRGELLEAWTDVADCEVVLLYPGFQISAGRAYSLGKWPPVESLTELTMAEANNKIQRFHGRINRSLPVRDLVENDFDAPLFENYPELSRSRTLLRRAGCEGVVVCGSGSTILGIPPAGQTETIRTRLKKHGSGTVLLSRTLSRRDFWSRLEAGGLGRTGSEPSK
jgi:4-diphosphocytidyl-2-C-methyl-D-erythritol kinase